MRGEKTTEGKVKALTGSPDHFSDMMICRFIYIAIASWFNKKASLFTLKPLENFKLSVPICVGQVVWVTRNHSEHASLIHRATHAEEMAQEIPAVCPGCCRASLFAPLARRVLASEPLDEVEVPLDGRKLHDIFLGLCHVPLCPRSNSFTPKPFNRHSPHHSQEARLTSLKSHFR